MVSAPFSSVTLTSSFLTSGKLALIRYSRSVSVISALGVQPSNSPCNALRLANLEYRLNKFSISRNGSQLTMFITTSRKNEVGKRVTVFSPGLVNSGDMCKSLGNYRRLRLKLAMTRALLYCHGL